MNNYFVDSLNDHNSSSSTFFHFSKNRKNIHFYKHFSVIPANPHNHEYSHSPSEIPQRITILLPFSLSKPTTNPFSETRTLGSPQDPLDSIKKGMYCSVVEVKKTKPIEIKKAIKKIDAFLEENVPTDLDAVPDQQLVCPAPLLAPLSRYPHFQ